jgi:molybdenum cofactor cytidylyltransferase
MKNVAAILLAAGQSRRMGAFKPLLPFGKQTVIESCLDYLTQGGVDSTVAVVGHHAEDIRKHLSSRLLTFAENPDPNSEMSASIAAGVQLIPESAVAAVIALVDYPAIPSSVVATLITEWSKGFRLIKPTWQGRGGHPVLVDLSLRAELQNLDPDKGLKALFERHASEVRRFEVDSPYIARDIDTWDDYRALYVEVFGESAPEPEPQGKTNEKSGRLI